MRRVGSFWDFARIVRGLRALALPTQRVEAILESVTGMEEGDSKAVCLALGARGVYHLCAGEVSWALRPRHPGFGC